MSKEPPRRAQGVVIPVPDNAILSDGTILAATSPGVRVTPRNAVVMPGDQAWRGSATMQAGTPSRPQRSTLVARPVAEVEYPRSWLFYGRSGSGKTTLGCTFPAPVCLFDIKDRGTDSVKDVDGLEVVEVGDWLQFEEIYWFIKSSRDYYRTYVFDTITQMQQLAMVHVRDKMRLRTRPGDWGSFTQKQWGEVAGMMKDQIINLRDAANEANADIVFLAQDRRNYTNDDSEYEPGNETLDPEVGAGVMPSVGKILNASVSVIGQTYIRNRHRREKVGNKNQTISEAVHCVRIGPSPLYITKIRSIRSNTPPPYIENPDYQILLEVIRGV